MSLAPERHAERDRQSIVFASFFIFFTFGLTLPLLYFVGGRYYAAIKMNVPRATSWFQAVTPWPMIAAAAILIAALLLFRRSASPQMFRRVSWTVIMVTSLVTLWGVFQFVSPMIGLLGGLAQ